MTQPCIKFITYTTFYGIFIALIIVSSLQFAQEEAMSPKFSTNYPKFFQNFTNYYHQKNLTFKFFEKDFYIRSSFPSHIDIAITVFIIGMAWHEIKQIYKDGIRDYLLSINNIVDLLMIILYVGSFALKYYSIFLVRLQLDRLDSKEFWQILNSLNEFNVKAQKDVFYTFYILNEDRFYWVSFDPLNVAEALFAIANLFSFGRICFFLPANQNLGPLQITLGRMINDIVKFIVIFAVIFMAFMFAINNLYWYYLSTVRNSVEIKEHIDAISHSSVTKAEEAFGTIGLTFHTIFWSIFGLGESENIDLKPFENEVTEFFGLVLYGTFHIASVIVLLNMLIAMMTRSYESILEDSDVEWKFARSRLYMASIKNGGTLPAPLNIIPTPKSLVYLIRRFFTRFKQSKKEKPEQLSDAPNSLSKSKTKPGDELTYKIVMQRIVKRFLLHSQRESSDSNERNFEELKQNLQMIRLEMQNDLKKNKEESFHSITLLHAGLTILGDELFKNSFNTDNLNRFIEYKYYGNEMRELYKEEFGDNEGNADVIHLGQKQFQFYNTNSPRNKPDMKKHFSFYDLVNQAMVNKDSVESKSIEDSPKFTQPDNQFSQDKQDSESCKKQVQFNEMDTIHQLEDVENQAEKNEIN